jgi:CsoR family transcriptional regulator, copper-sensing transcriptional repressor
MGMAIGCPARREDKVLEEHVAHCIAYAILSGDKADQRRTVAKLMAAIEGSDW